MSRDYRVGMFTFLGIVILCVLILWYGEEPSWFLTTRYELSVIVDNPTGIGEGTPAFMQGVQVGRVEAIRFLDPAQPSKGASVVVGVNEEYDIPMGSTATIHPRFGFDKGAVHIDPPAQNTKPLPRDKAFIQGEMRNALDSIVPQEYITTMVTAVDQIGGLVGDITELAARVRVVSEDLHELLQLRPVSQVDDPDAPLPANFYTVVQRFDGTLKSFNTLIAEGGELHAAVVEIQASARNLNTWSAGLDERTERLVTRADEAFSTVQRQADAVSTELLEVLGRASRVMDQANQALTAVNDGHGTVGKLLYDPKLYQEILLTMDRLQLLINDLRELKAWLENESILKGL